MTPDEMRGLADEQQYRVIADRDRGDDPQNWDMVEEGDRVVVTHADGLFWPVRIERPVPTTEEPKRRSFIVTPNNDRYDTFDIEDALINSHSFLPEGVRVQPAPQPPTREQIALDLLSKMWQAYAEQQCGWQDAACYHGHTACSKQGVGAAGLVFEDHLGLLANLMSAPIPEHFESKQKGGER